MVFGRDAARALLPLDGEAARLLGGRLRGFVSAPGNDRPDRRMQLLFVNGRLLRSSLLSGAWTSGYATYTMIGRHAVRRALSRFGARASRPQRASDQERRAAAICQSSLRRRPPHDRSHAVGSRQVARGGTRSAPAKRRCFLFAPPQALPLRVLTQLNRTFILASDGESLLLVDQHAAHERIAYEAIVASRAQRRVERAAAGTADLGAGRRAQCGAGRRAGGAARRRLRDRAVWRTDVSHRCDAGRLRFATVRCRRLFSTTLPRTQSSAASANESGRRWPAIP